MGTVGMHPRMDVLVGELRKQGWTLEESGPRVKAYPPDPGRQLVVFSRKQSEGSANDMVAVIRHLRHQGFVWPPANGKPAVEPEVSSTPFPPVNTTEVQTLPIQSAARAPAAEPRVEVGSEVAYVELKEAKEYAELAAAELREANRRVEEATKRRDEAAAAYAQAVQDLRQKKREFDAAFDVPGA